MKSVVSFLLPALLLVLFASQTHAQRFGSGMSTGERAKKQSEIMRDSLGLSDAQFDKVSEINLAFAKKMSEMRSQQSDGDWAALREQFTALQTEQEAAWKKVLTTTQFDKWAAIQKNLRAQRMQGRRGGGGQ